MKPFILGLQCFHCKDSIVSLSRHDFQRCSCGDLFIDGGFDYCRMGGSGPPSPAIINKKKLVEILVIQKESKLSKRNLSKLADFYLGKAALLREKETKKETK